MEALLGRIGIWFLILMFALAASVGARDPGFAAHATIVAIVAFVLMWATAARYDPLAKAQSLFRMPTGPSRYDDDPVRWGVIATRSEEHTSELQSLMRISYAVFCLKKKHTKTTHHATNLQKN